MKKLFALLAVVLGLASCQNEPEGLNIVTGGEIDTVVTVTLPEAETRATDPDWANSAEGAFVNEVLKGNATMRYILQVYYNGETNADNRQVQYSDDATVSFPVRLVPGRNYQFVVWADVVDGVDAESEYYYTADLKKITLKDGKWEAMDEKRDAFTASETINFNGALAINIPLYRPFAKLRVVTTDYDELAKQPGGAITPHHAVVTYYTKHRTAFNAYTSKPADASELIAHEYVIKTYGNEPNVTDDHTIFADYFFAEYDVVRFELSVYEANGELIKTTSFPTDINVKRNFLTTLKGNVLTEGGNISVTVNPEFGNPDNDYNVVTSANDLLKAIAAGGEYIIGNDITVNPGASTQAATRSGAATTTTIDLNGYTITLNVDIDLDGNHLIIAGEGSVVSENNNKIANGTVVVTGDANIDNGVVSATTGIAALQYICANGGTFTLSEDLTINEDTEIKATKPVVINGNGHTITFTSGNGTVVYRGFPITASNTVAFENVTIVNTANGGRCVDTRTSDINLTFNNVNLIAKGTNSQPLTIGGSDNDNLVVNLNNSTIKACHYGIITFNPVALNINNSEISGYAALYIKPGSAGSEINVVNSILTGPNKWAQHTSNSFATVAIEDSNININIDGNSTLVADSTYNEQALFAIGAGGATEALTGCNIVVAVGAEIEINEEKGSYVGFGEIQKYLYDNVIKFPAEYTDDLVAEGWVVSEPVNGLVTLDNTVVVSTADELVAALENQFSVKFANDIKIDPANMSNAYGKTGINVKYGQTIDGAGFTLNIKGAGGTWDSGINTTGGLIKDLTVTGSFRGIFINHNSDHSEKVVLENVTLGGNGMVYTISCDQGMYQTIEATNCTFNGWTSYAKTAGEAKFINCSFGAGSGSKYCRPYATTEFVNCAFEAGYELDPCATVTFENCTIGGDALTAENLSELVKAYKGAVENASVK